MIERQFLITLRKIYARLKDCRVEWAITGSLGMALQGMDVQVHDIDIQTDRQGAYEIESKLSGYAISPVHYSESERIRSHFGRLEIDGVTVEIMGDLQKRIDERTWEAPVKVVDYRRWVEIEGLQVPVLSLEYEYQAYRMLGRDDKAEKLREWLKKREG